MSHANKERDKQTSTNVCKSTLISPAPRSLHSTVVVLFVVGGVEVEGGVLLEGEDPADEFNDFIESLEEDVVLFPEMGMVVVEVDAEVWAVTADTVEIDGAVGVDTEDEEDEDVAETPSFSSFFFIEATRRSSTHTRNIF